MWPPDDTADLDAYRLAPSRFAVGGEHVAQLSPGWAASPYQRHDRHIVLWGCPPAQARSPCSPHTAVFDRRLHPPGWASAPGRARFKMHATEEAQPDACLSRHVSWAAVSPSRAAGPGFPAGWDVHRARPAGWGGFSSARVRRRRWAMQSRRRSTRWAHHVSHHVSSPATLRACRSLPCRARTCTRAAQDRRADRAGRAGALLCAGCWGRPPRACPGLPPGPR